MVIWDLIFNMSFRNILNTRIWLSIDQTQNAIECRHKSRALHQFYLQIEMYC